MGAGVKVIAYGIGLASESIHARKEAAREKRERETAPQGESSSSNIRALSAEEYDELADETLEAERALDDAQDDIPPSYSVLAPQNSRNQDPRSADQIVDSFLEYYSSPPNVPFGYGRLEYPVLLPQRRPKARSRGFIRAYAPALEPCGINQEQWLAFLDTFEKSSQANPWIKAINLASIATAWLPSITAIAVSIAIQVATSAAIEGHARYKTNDFLKKVNRDYFQPRGLFCLLMTWNPESGDSDQAFNMNTNVVAAMDSRNKFKSSNAKTYGEASFPEVAPLIFPGLDHLQNQTSEDGVQQQNKLKGRAFVADYMDRRAAAKYAAKHPESILATSVPAPKFHSRYADPAHPASSGDLFALITGGKVSAKGLKEKANGLKMRTNSGLGGRAGSSEESPRLKKRRSLGDIIDDMKRDVKNSEKLNVKKGVAKYLKQNVLYLLVVNMPSEEEMAAARNQMRH